MAAQGATPQLDPLWQAMHRFKRSRYDECIDLCALLLDRNELDMAAWVLKRRAMTCKYWVDDLDMDEQANLLPFCQNHQQSLVSDSRRRLAGRPLHNKEPQTRDILQPSLHFFQGSGDPASGLTQPGRPITRSGRPPTGFARPGTGARPQTSHRPATASIRPGTATVVRLATAATRGEQADDVLYQMGAADMNAFTTNQACAKVLCDFYVYHEHDPQKALDVCLAVEQRGEASWWWSARFGKCCYQLGMLQEAEMHFRRSLNRQMTIPTSLELAKIYVKQDQPNGAFAVYDTALAILPGDVDCLLGKARIQEMLNDTEAASQTFKAILHLDGSNVESLACLAAHHFYANEPHVALRYYRRILQMGVTNAEVWNNMGLCCLSNSRYDLSLQCFNQALRLSADAIAADVWYNIGHAALEIGELELAQQAFSTAVCLDSAHSEALNNIGVMHKETEQDASARIYFQKASTADADNFEASYNGARMAFDDGKLQEAFTLVMKAHDISPDHQQSNKLLNTIRTELSTV